MALIFAFSAEDAAQSTETSDTFVDVIVDTLVSACDGEIGESDIASFHERVSFAVRKSAHFAAYLVLGVLTVSAVSQHGLSRPAVATASLAICAAYAAGDELHQYFVPGRACSAYDVVLDTAGSLVGIILALLVMRAAVRNLKNNNETDTQEEMANG